jgi:CRP-like cAMP-binding protein
MPSTDRAAALARATILAGLSEGALAKLAAQCLWRDYDVGQSILAYQDTSTDVSFLVHGKARAIIYSPDGKAVIFTDLQPGAMFGEIAAIDRGPRSASVEAMEPCAVASLSAAQFEALVRAEPSVATATLRHLAGEVRRLSDRVFEFSTMVVRNRIHAELLRLAGGANVKQTVVILTPAPSLADIADRISTHREAVSRELARLVDIGLLSREGKSLRIADMAKLVTLVNEAKGELAS